MSRIQWTRWAPISGIVYVVLVAAAFAIASNDLGDSDAEILAYYGDGGNRAKEITACFLVIVAVLFFLWFLSALRDRLRSLETEPTGLPSLAFAAGVVSAVLLVAAVAVFVAVPFTIELRDEFQVDPNVARLLEGAGILLFTGAIMVASVLVAATSVVALRTAALPRWLGWVGLVVAVVLLAAIVFFPAFALLAWVLVVSVALIVRAPSSPSEGQALPEPA